VDDLIGKSLGGYRIEASIGEGGMAQVYRAHDLKLNRNVALKIIRPNVATSEEFLRRFEREARTVAALSHPHILKIFDYGQADRLVYLVMELMPGGSLADRIIKARLHPDEIERWLTHIADALDYAHHQGIVHRDMKPQNVLLDSSGNAVLTDFGIAKIVHGNITTTSITMTGAGVIIGTPAYMAPEQWRGDPIDARADIYALGVMLFEMLTGTVPFSGDTPFQLMYKHMNDQPTTLRMIRSDLPPGLQMVINKAMAKDKNYRYASASDLVAAYRAGLVAKEEIIYTDTTTALPTVRIPSDAPPIPMPAKETAQSSSAGITANTDGNTFIGSSDLIAGKSESVPKSTENIQPPPISAQSGNNRVALFVVGGVVLIGLFLLAFLLLNRPADAESANATGTAIALLNVTAVPTLTNLPVATIPPPTDTANPPTNTLTSEPTLTLTATLTPTSLPPTNTHTKTFTPTVDLQGTVSSILRVTQQNSSQSTAIAQTVDAMFAATIRARPTETPIPPTATHTNIPASSTNTAILPTNTLSLPTLTLVLPTNTRTALPFTPTRTPIPPTNTPRISATPTRIPTLPGGGTAQIIYGVNNGNNSEDGIFIVNLDGTGKKRIIPKPGENLSSGDPNLSPDGKLIVFSSNMNNGRFQIYTIGIDGTGQKQVLTSTWNDYRPVYSHSGTRIAFVRKGESDNYDIWVMNANGSSPRRLTTDAGFDSEPAWSVDDKTIYFNSSRTGSFQLWQMTSDGNNQKQISFSGRTDVYPDMSSDGRTVAYASDGGGTLQIWLLDAPTGQVKQITFSAGYSSWPAWSPDGNYIIFTTTRNGKEDIYIMNKDGSNQRPVVNGSDAEGGGGAKWVGAK